VGVAPVDRHPYQMTKAPVRWALGAWLAVGLLIAACGDGAEAPPAAETPATGQTPTAEDGGDFRLSSDAFGPNEEIPAIHTCDGQNSSPPLTWPDPPSGTQSFALIMDDPDAPGAVFTHWVLFDLPPDTRALGIGVETTERPSVGGAQGGNDAGGIGYTGPCPPPDGPHRYRFSLYALDALLELGPGASKEDVLNAMQGHILVEAQLMGSYGR